MSRGAERAAYTGISNSSFSTARPVRAASCSVTKLSTSWTASETPTKQAGSRRNSVQFPVEMMRTRCVILLRMASMYGL